MRQRAEAVDPAELAGEHGFARFVRTLGRGPGRARSLSRAEAREAFALILAGKADPHQVGAFLMLMRFRGEEPSELVGLVEAARAAIGAAPALGAPVDLDWPSYGAGRTRGAPWFLLSALLLAQAGYRVLMHGSNEFSTACAVADALAPLGRRPARDRSDAERLLDTHGFAFLPLAALGPPLGRMLQLRPLLGLRSPVNTVVRLLDPFAARAGVDGVFHPPYVSLHLDAAALLGRPRLLVLKGGGGEAERNPAKAVAAHVHDATAGRRELLLAPIGAPPAPEADLVQLWRHGSAAAAATVIGTAALGLLALGACTDPAEADRIAARLWEERRTG
ncbi:MAG: glycosyl transferase family protein [Alphaproteobacteria bacterium]|nr:glycosyl transferase family protein [Alphaproteobacteria bacterium]